MTMPSLPVSQRWRPRVTVACIVADGPRYLMVEENVNGNRCYNQPAGHLDEGESLTQAVVREVLEETGWTVALQHLVAIHQWHISEPGDAIIRFSFAARALHHDPTRSLDTGIHRVLWLSYTAIAALGDRLRSPLILQSIDAWLAGARWPLQLLLPPLGRDRS